MPEFDSDEDACAFADQAAAEHALHSTPEYKSAHDDGYESGLIDGATILKQAFKEAFWTAFHESGEHWFPYGSEEQPGDNQAVTQEFWQEILDALPEKVQVGFMETSTNVPRVDKSQPLLPGGATSGPADPVRPDQPD